MGISVGLAFFSGEGQPGKAAGSGDCDGRRLGDGDGSVMSGGRSNSGGTDGPREGNRGTVIGEW